MDCNSWKKWETRGKWRFFENSRHICSTVPGGGVKSVFKGKRRGPSCGSHCLPQHSQSESMEDVFAESEEEGGFHEIDGSGF